ncbi:MAG: phasin family protein [Alphaproteobacteria bacterium]|nr:phasin family protein [Alphaproteobacteria bacterium]OJV47824.1 MAG: hypothetical protein BGO28_05825 [Alphaproteobacteria bacterium 43-37]
MTQGKSPENNVDNLVENYKQNLQNLTKMTKAAGETVKNLTQLQNKYMQESLQGISGIANEIMAAQPVQRASLSQKAMNQGLNRAMAHSNAVLQALSQSATTWFEQLNNQPKKPSKSAN